ncbi:ABC transporter permease [Flavobacteriales bacterium]|nr:ABC transporter permease [Flavobacteriales bacterium]
MTSKFISKKLRKELSSGNKFSKPIIKVAITSITISMLVMLISISVVKGFQREIKNKVVNFSSHIQITDGGTNYTLETSPISINQSFYPNIENDNGIDHIQTFATKAGIIQSNADTVVYEDETKINRDIEGIVFKGINHDFNWANLSDKIIEGDIFTVVENKTSNEILISNFIAKRLKLKVNDKVRCYFFNGKKPIQRRFKVSGIFETGLEEFDNQFVLIDIKHTQKLNSWGVFTSLFLETELRNNEVVISANVTGGNGNYRYKFGERSFSTFNKVKFCANKDTVIQVIATDYIINTVTLNAEPISIPDTAWLKIKVASNDGNCITTKSEFEYESLNDSVRLYSGDNGTITTTLSTTGGSMKNYVGGFEIFITDFSTLNEKELTISRMSDPFLKVSKITDLESEIFGWLNVLDTNAIIIIILMIMVAVINIISLLLVLIVEKISMIGILKSFGAQNKLIRNVFIRLGAGLLIKGIVIGNLLAFLIIGLQSKFGFIKLPQDKYYLSEVPLGFEWKEFIIINIITIVIAVLILFFTSLFVARITPVKAIKFE